MLSGGKCIGRADKAGPDQRLLYQFLGKCRRAVEDVSGKYLPQYQEGHERQKDCAASRENFVHIFLNRA